MDTELVVTILNWAVIGVSLIALGVLLFRGQLRERTLALESGRDLGLTVPAYGVGAALAIGYVVLMLVASESGGLMVARLAFVYPLLIIGLLIGRAMNTEDGVYKIGLLPTDARRDARWGLGSVVLAVGLAGLAGMLMSWLSMWLGAPLDSTGHQSLRELEEARELGGGRYRQTLLNVVILAVIVAPLLEELVFRGAMQTCVMRLLDGGRWWAILFTAALFSVTHAAVVPWQMLVPLFVLGLVFGYVYERTGSLLTPVLTHAGFNAANIVILLAMPAG